MAEITLVVTGAELSHVRAGNPAQAQIAIRYASEDIAAKVRTLSLMKPATLTLGGCLSFSARDPGAIWRAHNEAQSEDFDALFELLARRPNREMRFLCDLS
jgi:hypothetical protein